MVNLLVLAPHRLSELENLLLQNLDQAVELRRLVQLLLQAFVFSQEPFQPSHQLFEHEVVVAFYLLEAGLVNEGLLPRVLENGFGDLFRVLAVEFSEPEDAEQVLFGAKPLPKKHLLHSHSLKDLFILEGRFAASRYHK